MSEYSNMLNIIGGSKKIMSHIMLSKHRIIYLN